MVRIGIIGTDAIAHIHTGGLLTNNNYDIAGCYAPDNRKSMVFARQYRLVSYSSIEALFKFTDAIDIAGSFPEATDLAEKCLKEMKHVYITQPYRLDIDEIKYLMKLANESGVVLQVGTGYRYCPVYESLSKIQQKPRIIDIRHNLLSGVDLLSQLNFELVRDLDFVLGILHANISKIDVKTWTKSESYLDLLNCRIECDNGCSVNMIMHTISEGDPKLEITCNYSDTIIRTDVFKSVIEKQYCDFDVTDSIVLDAYSEKTIHKQYLRNFYKAICNDPEALHQIDDQMQCISAADYIVERIKQLQLVTSY